MRLPRLSTDFSVGAKLKMRMMRLLSRREVPDVVKVHYYRYDFFGKHIAALFQEAMRGPSAWSVFDREAMAAFVSARNQCVF